MVLAILNFSGTKVDLIQLARQAFGGQMFRLDRIESKLDEMSDKIDEIYEIVKRIEWRHDTTLPRNQYLKIDTFDTLDTLDTLDIIHFLQKTLQLIWWMI